MTNREAKSRLLPNCGPIGRNNAAGQVAARIALSLAAMSILNYVIPISHSWKPALALSFFLLLVLRRQTSRARISSLPPLSIRAVATFLALILLVVFASFGLAGVLRAASHNSVAVSSLLAFGKLLVLIPALALFVAPAPTIGQLAPEAIAAAIALLTFDPGRFFGLIWPAYSRIVAGTIATLSQPFLPGVHLVPGLDYVLVVGSARDMVLDMSCSGIKGIVLFQILFALILIVEWNRINKLRSFFFYAAGCALLLVANVVRLAIVFLTSNLTSDTINPSWPLFILTLLLLTWFTYDWMMPTQSDPVA